MSAFSIASIVIGSAIYLVTVLWIARIAVRVRGLQVRYARLRASDSESLQQQLRDLSETVEQLANRVKMMKVRNAINHVNGPGSRGEPDARLDPEGWRAWKNSQLKTGVVN